MSHPNYDRPAGYDGQAVLNAVRQYWLDSYGNIREKSANTLEMIHDAFQPLSYWNGWQRPPQYQGVALDTHIYQMFTDDVSPLIVFQDLIGDMARSARA
jgi:glucan 1,3-beta-glucosidase